MQGHHVQEGETILDVLVGQIHILTLRAPEAGKILQIAAVGAVVGPDAHMVEITTVGTPTWEVFIAYRQTDSVAYAGRLESYREYRRAVNVSQATAVCS